MNLPEKFQELARILETFELAEEKARQLLPSIPKGQLFLGIRGIETDISHFELIEELCSFRRVTNAPGLTDVCRAANLEKTDWLGVSRYSHGIVAELAIGYKNLCHHRFLHNVSWNALALLKLRGHNRLTCPVSASVSWDVVSGISDNSVSFELLDDVPKHLVLLPKPTKISIEDLEWVKAHHLPSLRLQDKTKHLRFGLAFNLAYRWNHTTDLRIAIANLWVGLEALFGDTDQPVKANLAKRISAWLPGTTDTEVRDLYKNRCEAVHGRWLDDNRIIKAIQATEDLLRRSLVKCIETNSAPLPDWK